MTEILTYHTALNKEDMAVKEIMENSILSSKVCGVAFLPDVRNYIFIEIPVEERDFFINNCRGNKYVKGMVRGVTKVEEITKHKDILVDFKIDDKILVCGGPLKGSKGKVIGLDKKDITILLNDSAVQIPVKLDRSMLSKDGLVSQNSKSHAVGYDGKSDAMKQMGIMKEMDCPYCGTHIDYLYIPSHKTTEIEQNGSGSKVFRVEVNAKVIGDLNCPNEDCNKNLCNVYRKKEDGCRVLR